MSEARAAPQYVAVAVPAPLHSALSYEAPAGCAPSELAGTRVRVPLGRRVVTGVILGPADAPPDGVSAKPLLELLDEPGRPALPADLVETILWASDYYVAPPGETARAAVPAPVSRDDGPPVERVVAPTAAVRADPQRALGGLDRAPAQRRALEAALAGEPATRAELARTAKAAPAAVTALVARGLLEERERPRPLAALPDAGFPVEPPRRLTDDQRRAVSRLGELVDAGRSAAAVLFGVTGSGKTEVYLRTAERVLGAGRSVLMLVPEIGLTPKLAHALQSRFGQQVVVQHSGLGARQRADAWRRARDGQARVVVGARSALFAPLADLGLVVVDEEHDGGYKQEETPRYHARDLALVRGAASNAVVVLGSATPSLEAFALVDESRAELLRLPERVAGGTLPAVELVDMRDEFRESGSDSPLSRRLVEQLRETHARGEQSMVLLNRRGFASAVLCRECGNAIECRQCSIAQTWHRADRRLTCHYCGYARPRPERCPGCSSEHLADVGAGTQRLEADLADALEGARIARLDRDTARSPRRLADVLGGFSRGEIDVLVGTQMIAKGHHFPRVTLVGVVGADAALHLPDFRAAERAFQLVTQVAGRAGRGERPGSVVVQAYQPDHPALAAAVRHDYESFATSELAARRALRYPPAAALANLVVRDRDQARAFERAHDLAARIRDAGDGRVAVLGPTTAPIARIRGAFRVQMLVRSMKRRRAIGAIRRALLDLSGEEGAAPRWLTIDIDPQQLL